MLARCRLPSVTLMSVLLLGGCGVSRHAVSPEPRAVDVAYDATEDPETALLARRSKLLSSVEAWRGTPYRYGGNSQRGIDCSGFTSRIFDEVFDVRLPRTTRAQKRSGARVERSDLLMGDLVFFRTPSRTDHVGIYIGSGEFAHSSSSSGVMISHLGEPYWADSYRESRRVLPFAQPPSPPVRDTSERETLEAPPARVDLTEVARPPRRVGW